MKKILIFLTLIIISVFLVCHFIFNKDDNVNIDATKENKATEEVKSFTEKTFSEGQTIKELSEISNGDVFSEDILIGEESYLREKPSIEDDELDKYKKAQKKYASRVEEYIKKNFDYKIENTITSIEGIVAVTVTHKNYYYFWYLVELKVMEEQLLKMSGYIPDSTFDGKVSQETNKIYYKIKIKAMEILDDYLDDYVNDNEYFTSTIKYDPKNKSNTADSIMQYNSNLSGAGYSDLNMNSPSFQKKVNERVNSMINKAKQEGILNTKDLLKLN